MGYAGVVVIIVMHGTEMLREGRRKIRRALSAPSPRALLAALRRHETKTASDRQSLISRSQFYADDVPEEQVVI